MKAFILCAGVGSRLRPITLGFPKAAVPFLNLPLLYYNWFYLEKMGLTHGVLNSHLFPETLKDLVYKVRTPEQKVDISFEPQSLGSAGGLFNLKSFFAGENQFLYLNGDSLFFPSSPKIFEEFLVQGARCPLGLFWATPLSPSNASRALWMDRDQYLRVIGGVDQVHKSGFKVKNGKDLDRRELRPVQFSGLALLKGDIFKFLSPKTSHIFYDVAKPLFKEGAFKVFLDEKGLIFEGGEIPGLLKATEHCLKSLFSEKSSFTRDWLLKMFKRFDPEDKKVGFKRGQILKQEKNVPLLCPNNVKGVSLFQVKGFAVLGQGVSFTGKSFLNSSVLGEKIPWRGTLEKQILFGFNFN